MALDVSELGLLSCYHFCDKEDGFGYTAFISSLALVGLGMFCYTRAIVYRHISGNLVENDGKEENVGIARNIKGHWRLIGFGEILWVKY